GSTKQEIIDEAKRIEKECLQFKIAHSRAANFWEKSHLFIGVPTTIISTLAAAVIISGMPNAMTIAAFMAIFVAAFIAVSTFLNPKDRANSYVMASSKYDILRNKARYLTNIESRLKNDDVLASQLKELVDKHSDLLQNTPAIPRWAMRKATVEYSQSTTLTSEYEGAKVLKFENCAEVYNHIATKISEAEISIDDITWGSRKDYRTKEEQDAYENYLLSINDVCAKGKVKYREISSLTDEHYFKRAIGLVKSKHYSYHLGYYDTSSVNIPLISYIIIDRKEAIFGFYRAPFRSIEDEVYLQINDSLTLQLFIDYFETLWTGSTKIKEGKSVNISSIKSIADKLKIDPNYLSDL
ncbi:MAG: SLATT domain-containing protein, partial [Ignavibacteriaceae bacterium]|nr:SLATT domain-containing protein [Ignavibacteriaceae bacterium]